MAGLPAAVIVLGFMGSASSRFERHRIEGQPGGGAARLTRPSRVASCEAQPASTVKSLEDSGIEVVGLGAGNFTDTTVSRSAPGPAVIANLHN